MADQPALPTSVVSSAAVPLMQVSKQQRAYLCTDEAGIRQILTLISSEEREHVLTTLGPDYTNAFHTVGFCDKRPVQILSPFDIEPGPQRRAFLETLASHEAKNAIAEMPYLVYWFDTSLETGVPYVTLEPNSSIMSYEFGEKLNYDQVPKEISKKLLGRTQELTRSEQILCDALVAMEAARESRALPWEVVPPDDVLYQIVRADDKGMLPPTPVSRKKQQMAADALLQMLGTPKTPSLENVPHERLHQQQPGMPQAGDRVKIWWESMKTYYYGYVDGIRCGDFYFIVYDDEETQWLPLADHKFELVPEDEYAEETPPAREVDPRFHCPSPSKPLNYNKNHKSSPSVQRKSAAKSSKLANRDEDSESEWKSSGAEKQGSPVAAIKTVKSRSGKMFVDGLWIMEKPPRKDAKGFYSRPSGRSPKGFEWDGQNGWFAPISTTPTVMKKRKIAPKDGPPKKKSKMASKKTKLMGRAELMHGDDNDDDDDFPFGKKPPGDAIPRRDCRRSKPPEAGQASAEEGSTPTNKQSPGPKDAASTLHTNADTCNPSKENVATKNTSLDVSHASHKVAAEKKPSKVSLKEARVEESMGIGSISQEKVQTDQNTDVERTAAKIAGLLPLRDDSTSRIHQVHDLLKILDKGDELSFSQGTRKSLRKPIKQLKECKQNDIRALAHSLSLKLKASYYVSFMLDLRKAVAEKDVDSVKLMVSYLYKKVTEGKKRLELDDAFIHKHGLLNLLVEISFLFHAHKVVMAELPKLENILNENMILEDNAEI